MKLGTIKLKNNLILSPLLNVSTAPYRQFCRTFHPIGLVCVPMIYTKRLISNPNSIIHELLKIEEESPISVQLIGNNEEALKRAINFLESYKFDVLDINAGCPSNRAIKAKEGGYLLKDLKKLESLLKIALKYSSRPVSLKTRIGFENSNNNIEFRKIINDSGLEFLTLHARTVKDRFDNSTLDLDAFKKFKEKISIPVVGNGDIFDAKSAKHFLDHADVNGLMIGRGTMGNPEIFRQVHEYLTRGKEIAFKNNKDKCKSNIEIYEQIIDKFLEDVKLNHSHEEFKFVELKRNSIWLTKNIENSTIIRRELSKTKNLNHLKETIQNCLKSN